MFLIYSIWFKRPTALGNTSLYSSDCYSRENIFSVRLGVKQLTALTDKWLSQSCKYTFQGMSLLECVAATQSVAGGNHLAPEETATLCTQSLSCLYISSGTI